MPSDQNTHLINLNLQLFVANLQPMLPENFNSSSQPNLVYNHQLISIIVPVWLSNLTSLLKIMSDRSWMPSLTLDFNSVLEKCFGLIGRQLK